MAALQPGTLIYPAFIHLAPGGRRLGLSAGILLAQAYYLSRRTPGGWEHTPYDWMDRTGLSRDQVSDGLRRLVACGLLQRVRRGQIKRMTYRLDLALLERLLCGSVTGKSGHAKPGNPYYAKPENPVTSNRDPFLNRKEREGATAPKSAAPQHAARPGRAATRAGATPGGQGATGADRATWPEWKAYARELSEAWANSPDCRLCWDDMEGGGWKDGSRRLVRDWQAKARRYLAVWRRSGGAAEERAKAAAPARSTAADRGRELLARAEALATAGEWDHLARLERSWKRENPEQFAFYLAQKRPTTWPASPAA